MAQFDVQNLVVHGTATGITPSVGDSSTKLATTAFVAANQVTVSILAFGGVGDGVTDNTTALNNALASAQYAGRVTIAFPAGKFLFNSGITYTVPNTVGRSVSIVGAGQDITELYWPNASGGMIINCPTPFQTFHLRDFSMTTGTAGLSQALSIFQNTTTITNPANTPPSDITRVTFRDTNGYALTSGNYWSFCVNITRMSSVTFESCYFTGTAPSSGSFTAAGTGVGVTGTASANAVVYTFINCAFNYIGTGVTAVYSQGFVFSGCNFTGGTYGITTPVGGGASDQISIWGCQFNCGNNGIVTGVHWDNTLISGCLFINDNASCVCIYLQDYNSFSITGNAFNGSFLSNQLGILANNPDGGIGGVITGNVFTGLTTAIQLTSSSIRVNVQSNSYIANSANNVLNQGVGTGNLANVVGGGSI